MGCVAEGGWLEDLQRQAWGESTVRLGRGRAVCWVPTSSSVVWHLGDCKCPQQAKVGREKMIGYWDDSTQQRSEVKPRKESRALWKPHVDRCSTVEDGGVP